MKALMAARIRELRVSAGLTQEQLAERVGHNTATTTIARYERGEYAPPLDAIDRICAALGISATEFVAGIAPNQTAERTPELWRILDLLSGQSAAHLKSIRKLLRAHLEARDVE